LLAGSTNGSDEAGAAGATLTEAENAPLAFVIVDTSPVGNVAGAVAPTIGTGPTITVAPDSGVVCAMSLD
jgi:putative aminopeptidase FrvX